MAGVFASGPMEQSKAGYYADFIVYPLLIAAFGGSEINGVHGFPYLWLCSLALGLVIWTIVEYGVHRFVLHSFEAVARLHTQHHATPTAYVGTPTWTSMLCFALGGFIPAFILFGWDVASGATTGLMLGYLWYLIVHDAVHRRHLKYGSLLYRAKMHHVLHHRANVPSNFGVTSSFWDQIFGTRIVPVTRRSVEGNRRGARGTGTEMKGNARRQAAHLVSTLLRSV